MSDIICVTNRALCRGSFVKRIEALAVCRPKAIILREKDLPEADYADIAGRIMDICQKYGTPCILHTFYKQAILLGAENIHLPLPLLKNISPEDKRHFKLIGVSVHSVSEAAEAQKLGASYLTAGHIFDTDCKKGLPARGLDFLHEAAEAVDIPVYAIGGITAENIDRVRKAGAAGACVMSSAMTCEDPFDFLRQFGG